MSKKGNKKDDSSTEDNKNTEITDGNNATATQIGDPVYVTNMVSNLHAGKDFYLDSLKSNYHLSFSDDFASVMEEIEREYKEKKTSLTSQQPHHKAAVLFHCNPTFLPAHSSAVNGRS